MLSVNSPARATADVTNTPPRRGRPRDARCDQVILQATLDMLIEAGAANLSIDGVAHRAGVGKATIYRRWSSKEALVLEALGSDTATLDVPDTGNLRKDLEAYFDVLIERFSTSKGSDVLPILIEAACHDAEVRASLDDYIKNRRQPVRLGPVTYRRFITRGRIDTAFIDTLLDIVL
jgi:AcrR family transcriptional regulator